MSEKFYQDTAKIAEAIDALHRRAVIAYTPLVEDICSREATKQNSNKIRICLRWSAKNLYVTIVFGEKAL
jgi:hypothetical protein